MNVRREPRQESYDVVIVGSGMGGLTSAALLARAGKRVLVVERHDRPGGYAHSFRRKKYLFDAAVHQIGGCEPVPPPGPALIDVLLRLLGVRDRCEFLRVDPFYTALFPGFRISGPLGVEPFIDVHSRLFPRQERGLRRLVEICSKLRGEAFNLPTRLSFWDWLRTPRRYPTLFRYHGACLGEMLDEHLTDSRLKSALASLWPYLGLPPSRLSFLYWALMLTSYVEEGAFYCRGTFQNLADALVAALQKDGGEILLGSLVRRIVLKDRRVSGVILENGYRIETPLVISNGDAMETFQALVGVEFLPSRFVRRLRRMKPSLSAFVLYLATDLDLKTMEAAHEMFSYRTWDHDQTYRDILEGKPAGIVLNVPTLVDPTLAPPGEHLLSVTSLIPYGIGAPWRRQKSRYADALLDEVEAVFPGFRSHITFAEGASPRTMERYTLNLTGSIYGWEVSPAQVGPKRLANRTPVRGLYLAGHWTQPGGGIYGVVTSGLLTAQAVLGYADTAKFFTELQGHAGVTGA